VLPPPPAVVLDVGGAAGAHAAPLAAQGHEVHLIDPVPLHVEQARAVPGLASVTLGDARALRWLDASVDAALLLGPLYHLTDRADRVRALVEGRRVLRPGGVLVAAAISRYASTLDGLFCGYLREPGFEAIVECDLADGQHRNPGDVPGWFTTAFFHLPDELLSEATDAGLHDVGLVAVEVRPGCCLISTVGSPMTVKFCCRPSAESNPVHPSSARAHACSSPDERSPDKGRPSPHQRHERAVILEAESPSLHSRRRVL
jgi:SAM-dependent methyltransferase